MTYSIIVVDMESRLIGIGVVSGSIAVGSRVPWARAGVGGVVTQAYTNPLIGKWVLEFLERGWSPRKALDEALRRDEAPSMRQIGVVSINGEAVAHTGHNVPRHYGEVVGKGYVCVGNMLASKSVVKELCKGYEESSGSLSERIMSALQRAHDAGGDIRGDRSACLLVVGEHPVYGYGYDRIIDLRVDYSKNPVEDLRNLYELWMRIR